MSAAAAALTLVATRDGPALSHDSVNYLSLAVHLARSGRFINYAGHEVTWWPPGFPFLLSIGESVGVGGEFTSRMLTSASFAGIVLLAHLLLRMLGTRVAVRLVILLFISLSPAILSVSVFVWTEAPFALISMLFLVVLTRVWLTRTVTRAATAALAVLSWAGFCLRYAGIVLIVTSCLLVFTLLRSRPRQALRSAALLGVASSVLPLAWMSRNFTVDGTLLGPGSMSPDSVVEVGFRVLHTIGLWFVPIPDSIPGYRQITTLVAVFVAQALLLSAYLVLRSHHRCPGAAHKGYRYFPIVAFVSVYVVYIAAVQLTRAIDPIDNRLLIPVFVPVVIIVGVAFEAMLSRSDHPRVGAGIRLAIVASLLLSAVTGIQIVSRSGWNPGIDFGSDRWLESELSAETMLAHSEEDLPIFTNEMLGLWVATRIEDPIRELPRLEEFGGPSLEVGRMRFRDELAELGGCSLVAVYWRGWQIHQGVDDLGRDIDLSLVHRAEDGELLRGCTASQRVPPP